MLFHSLEHLPSIGRSFFNNSCVQPVVEVSEIHLSALQSRHMHVVRKKNAILYTIQHRCLFVAVVGRCFNDKETLPVNACKAYDFRNQWLKVHEPSELSMSWRNDVLGRKTTFEVQQLCPFRMVDKWVAVSLVCKGYRIPVTFP